MDGTQFVENLLPPQGVLVIAVLVGEATSRRAIITELKWALFDPTLMEAFKAKYDMRQYASSDDAMDNAPMTHQILSLEIL